MADKGYGRKKDGWRIFFFSEGDIAVRISYLLAASRPARRGKISRKRNTCLRPGLIPGASNLQVFEIFGALVMVIDLLRIGS